MDQSEYEILVHPRFVRGKWMLDNQIESADDLIKFWTTFGLTV